MTDRHYIEFTVQAARLPQAQFEAIVDKVADLLIDSAGVIDPDIGADLEKRELTFCMTVEAPGVEQAMERVLAVARATLHAAGGETPGWESINFSIPTRSENGRLLAL